MIDNMDQGVLVVDADNRVQFVNQTALKTLGVVQNNIIGKPVRFRPLTFESNFTHGHMQHIVSWDDKSELIIGQLHNIRGPTTIFNGVSPIAYQFFCSKCT